MNTDSGDRRCTMRDIGAALALSTMTVSRALRNAPEVDVATRARVLETAKRLDYRPDPALAALSAYRHGARGRSGQGVMAFVTNFRTPDEWRQVGTFARYFAGAERRAHLLGYRLEPFWVGDPKLTARRASQILRERGIRGLLVGPLANGQCTLELEWGSFCAVALGRSLAQPGLTTVTTHHMHVVELAWQEARRRGFRRIGLAVTAPEDIRTMGALRASYLLQQARADAPRLPVLLTPGFAREPLQAWLVEQRAEVLLSSEQGHYDLLDARARRRLSFIHLNVSPDSRLAGIDQGHDLVGEQAAALLHLKLIQRQMGVPGRREILMVDGTWHEGTLHPPPRVTPASERT